MLIVKNNMQGFEYDIHSLVKAFYGEETVKVVSMEKGQQDTSLASREPFLCVELFENLSKLELTVFKGVDKKQSKELKFVWKFDAQLFEKKKEFKNEFKKFFYEVLCKITGKKLPWGNLTGIRPTKLAMGMLENQKSQDEILAFLEKEHFVSREKAELSIEIAKREKELLSTIHYKDGYSLYVGIPFCPTTCLYCSFTSYPICSYKNRVEEYIDCLIKEMKFVAKEYSDKVLDTVYIGGGTPTTLEAEQLDRLISGLKEHFSFEHVKEFTVEAGRADSITKEKLQVLFNHGVTRISVNPQTMKDATLKLIGRRHSVEQVKEAFALAREVGFTNINMDLILGLPEETVEDVADTISEIKKLAPDSLTIHSLAVKRASKLNQWIEEHGISMLKNTDETMEIAVKGARELHMKPYYLYRQKNMAGNFENVGYATEGNFGIYNILIMEEKQTIVALGAGSITKRVFPDGRIERCDNVKDVALYIEKIDEMIERKKVLLGD